MDIVSSFSDLLQVFAMTMTPATHGNLRELIAGWVFAPRRTITGMLRAGGRLVQDAQNNPKLALSALHTMMRQLGNSKPLGQIDLREGYNGYLFEDQEQMIAVLWPTDAEYSLPTEVSLPRASVQVIDLFGRILPVQSHQNQSRFDWGRELIYVRLGKLSGPEAAALLREAIQKKTEKQALGPGLFTFSI